MGLWESLRGTKFKGFILALSGGGVRGLAHLGVLEVLEQHKLRPDAIVGTSAGALFGAMYALNPDIATVRARVLSFLTSDAFQDLGLPPLSGEDADEEDSWLSRLSSVARQTSFYTRVVRDTSVANTPALIDMAYTLARKRSFSDARIPVYITAVRFPGGECQLLSKGDISLAIAASMAIPGAFDPVEINGEKYLDGGLASEVPAYEARAIAEPDQLVVAVNTGSRPDPENPPTNVIEMLDWATRIKALYLRRYEKKNADILIEPLVGYTQWHDFAEPEREIAKGRETTKQALPELFRHLR